MCFGVGVDGLHHIVFENPVLGCASGFEGTQECAHGMGSSSRALIDVVNANQKLHGMWLLDQNSFIPV